MRVVLAVRDGQADFVDMAAPVEDFLCRNIELPGFLHLIEEHGRGFADPGGLRDIDAVAFGQRADAGAARIGVQRAAEHVVEQAFAHGRLADVHLLEPEGIEDRIENGHAAGDDLDPVAGQARQIEQVAVADLEQCFAENFERGRADALL